MDGRIFEQAKGLKENFKTPVFILEGGPKYGGPAHLRPKLNKNALHSSLLSISCGFGIPIIPSSSATDTANIIYRAALRENKDGHTIRANTRKKPKTLKEQRQFILESFPGVGPKIASTINDKPYALFQILEAISTGQIDDIGPKKLKILQEVLNSVKI